MTAHPQEHAANSEADADGDALWDTRQLGASEAHCVPVSDEVSRQIDAALGLEPTELRLTIELVASFKQLAAAEGIGYRPLMRRALAEYVQSRGLPSAPSESRVQLTD